MEYLLLKTTFFDLTERLDQYFDGKLRHESKLKADLENHKTDLLQDLAVELWANYNRETYQSYTPAAFIWLKAEKVWISFVRKLKRQPNYEKNIEVDSLTENYSENDFLKKFELQNTVARIEDLLKPQEIKLLQYRAEGFTYKEIMTLTNYPSEDAAKTRFNRIKKFVQLRFRRY